MRIFLCRSHTFPSYVVRGCTWSPWSHAAIGTGPAIGTVIESKPTMGVQEGWFSDFIWDNDVIEALDLYCKDEDAAIQFARDQIGKPYDFGGVIAIPFHQRDWHDPNRWFCFELVAAAFEAGGTPLFRKDALYRVTGANFWMLPESNLTGEPYER